MALADTYKKVWENRQIEEINSTKSMLDLEWCIANSLTDFGAPNVFHGEGKVSISNFSGLIAFNSIELNELGDHRLIKLVRIQQKKTREQITNCVK